MRIMDFMLSFNKHKVFKAYYRKDCEIENCIELRNVDIKQF